MRSTLRWLCVLLTVSMLFTGACGAAQVKSRNPLIDAPELGAYTQTEDEFINVLLLGIDYGGKYFTASGGKKVLEECHTDGVVVASLNLTKNTISLVSIPRDSLTYVPGVRGIYKLNGAINCADTLGEGLERACDAASWHLGGIRVDKYIAVDATALIALGDAIGGVDFNVDMYYRGAHGKYEAGMQHLNGKGIMDYMRARKNATKDGHDLGRTRRQREMLAAIFAKLKGEPELIANVADVYQSGKLNILTNLDLTDAMKIVKTAFAVDRGSIGLHVLEGPYRTFHMNFTFNDQEKRQQVIKAVYGVDVPEIPYVSYAYTKWLTEYGLTAAKSIGTARAILAYAAQVTAPTAQQQAAYDALDSAADACIEAFDKAADTLAQVDTSVMMGARSRMKDAVNAAAEAFNYEEPYNWTNPVSWYREPMINEYQYNWK